MIQQKKSAKILTHTILIIGIIVLLFPLYFALVASTHTASDLVSAPLPLLPGSQFLENYRAVLSHGSAAASQDSVAPMLLNSFIMAFVIALGKIVLALLSAYAFVYFRFPCRRICFILIFATLMLPVEVRIVPTFQIAAKLNLLNSYAGLTLPLLASATATFLFRQFFLTIPDELCEAAKMDGAGPWRFLWHVVLPLSKTNIVALFIVMFIYGWNQYLWPLVITTTSNMNTVVMGMQKLATTADQIPQWNLIMATAILALLPPVLVMIITQRWFVKGLIETEK